MRINGYDMPMRTQEVNLEGPDYGARALATELRMECARMRNLRLRHRPKTYFHAEPEPCGKCIHCRSATKVEAMAVALRNALGKAGEGR